MAPWDRWKVHKQIIIRVAKEVLHSRFRNAETDSIAQLQICAQMARAVAYNDINMFSKCCKNWSRMGDLFCLARRHVAELRSQLYRLDGAGAYIYQVAFYKEQTPDETTRITVRLRADWRTISICSAPIPRK